MRETIKILIGYLNIPRLLPHIILYGINPERHKDDIIRNALFPQRSLFSNFINLLVFKRYYRTLFYHRVGYWSFFIKFLCPTTNTLFFISPDTVVGKGMNCGHCFSTVVNAISVGDNFSVYQNVTIGVKGGVKPIIKNNVSIFANSVVLGNIIIDDNVVIGAGAVVTKSVPKNCVVIGNPAYIIRRDGQKTLEKL